MGYDVGLRLKLFEGARSAAASPIPPARPACAVRHCKWDAIQPRSDVALSPTALKRLGPERVDDKHLSAPETDELVNIHKDEMT